MSKKKELEITKMMEVLEISREEAIEMLKCDKEDIVTDEVAKIEEKAKENSDKKPKKKGDSLAKVKMQRAKKKEDLVKDDLMNKIKEMVKDGSFNSPQEMTSSKITFTSSDGVFYSVSLTKHKVKPDGYSDK